MNQSVRPIIDSREALISGLRVEERSAEAAEGGCGVLGLAASVPIAGRHLVTASQQMHNRGNGKGGGIAAAGLDPAQMGVSPEVLRTHTLLQVAYIDRGARAEVERECLEGRFDVLRADGVETVDDYRDVPGLEMRPPDVVRYFCRVRPEVLARFAEEMGLRHLPARQVEDEYVYQNSFRLNQRYYASLGDQRAFVLCHGRDLLVFKLVGYAEQAAAYYRLDDLTAHVWIAHQRYPTKGRVWHPGGAHPFIGVNEALVHNGDFANHHRVSEYLRQRNIIPLFLTDTEVSVLLFDLWDRVYGYPLQVLLEALAPTTERDLEMLPADKQALYRAVQQVHLHGSPDGPWFFIVARSHPDRREWQLLGITDTSMLRPQVFALGGESESQVAVGLIASERQAINACLRSLAAEDPRFLPVADRYWVARGGSYTDGGAFVFTVSEGAEGRSLRCEDKFGRDVPRVPPDVSRVLPDVSRLTLDGLTRLRDRRDKAAGLRRAALLAEVDRAVYELLRAVPALDEGSGGNRRVDWATRDALRSPAPGEEALLVDASGFPPEGPASAARLLCQAHALGWRRFVAFDWRGGRFAGCGLGPDTDDVRVDVYGDPGDYLASGLDGATVVVHGDAQDQVGQILQRGRLVIHGDVGQTFLYGAKGGEVYVLGSAAGRPLINAVGRPRVVINGTCLDYLAESFMAGDPLNGGGFVVLNGVAFDAAGRLVELETPYSGGNLFSLASGGAVYLRDPHGKVDESQLNGGQFAPLSGADWALIEPYLQENEALFGVTIADLLSVDGRQRPPEQVYRKIEVKSLDVLR